MGERCNEMRHLHDYESQGYKRPWAVAEKPIRREVQLMSLRTKVLSCAGALIAAASLSVVPLTAHADAVPNPGVSDTIWFQGTTTSLTCDPAYAEAASNTCGGAANGVPVQGGEGTYTFAGSCSYTSDTGPTAESGNCNITSSGEYENSVCGTGEASGTATLTPVPADPTEGGTISYNIDFVDGIGTFDSDALEATPQTSGGADAGQRPGSDVGAGEADVVNSVTENEQPGSTYTAFVNTTNSNITLTPGAPGTPGSGICVTGWSAIGTVEVDEISTAP
jgi:hypothetical protein